MKKENSLKGTNEKPHVSVTLHDDGCSSSLEFTEDSDNEFAKLGFYAARIAMYYDFQFTDERKERFDNAKKAAYDQFVNALGAGYTLAEAENSAYAAFEFAYFNE